MAKRVDLPVRAPAWPWGGPRSVREKLVDPAQFDRKKKAKKLGDPKQPPLASNELLDFIGPGHTADELRLPMPPFPGGHDADLTGFNDLPMLESVAERGQGELSRQVEAALTRVSATPERRSRLEALLRCERQMLALLGPHRSQIQEIQRKRRETESTF
jgi:hypothetical protein